MKEICPVIAITATFFLCDCGWFAPMEMHKTESGRTTFRSAEQTPAQSEVAPAPQKIPGESR